MSTVNVILLIQIRRLMKAKFRKIFFKDNKILRQKKTQCIKIVQQQNTLNSCLRHLYHREGIQKYKHLHHHQTQLLVLGVVYQRAGKSNYSNMISRACVIDLPLRIHWNSIDLTLTFICKCMHSAQTMRTLSHLCIGNKRH